MKGLLTCVQSLYELKFVFVLSAFWGLIRITTFYGIDKVVSSSPLQESLMGYG
jgi:hypothetical protein